MTEKCSSMLMSSDLDEVDDDAIREGDNSGRKMMIIIL
jgi:hypothetical protein